MVCDVEILNFCWNIFLVFACVPCYFLCQTSQISSKMVNFLFQPILVPFFVTMAAIKVEVIWDFYTLVIVLINY